MIRIGRRLQDLPSGSLKTGPSQTQEPRLLAKTSYLIPRWGKALDLTLRPAVSCRTQPCSMEQAGNLIKICILTRFAQATEMVFANLNHSTKQLWRSTVVNCIENSKFMTRKTSGRPNSQSHLLELAVRTHTSILEGYGSILRELF